MIHEGPRYFVRNVIIEGNSKLKTPVLREDLELHSGRPFLQAVRDADKNRMLIKYNEIGCIDTQIAVEPKFTNESGIVDLVYKIDEGEPYLLAELKIEGNARTRDKVIRREAVMAGLLPGEVLDQNRIEIFRRRLMALGYFQTSQGAQQNGKQPIVIKIVGRRPKDKPYGDLMMPLIGEVSQARMQDPGPGSDPAPAPLPVPDALPPLAPQGAGNAPAPGAGGLLTPNPFDPQPDTMPPINVPSPPPGAADRWWSGPRSRRGPARAASRRDRRASGELPQHPRYGHDERRARPQRSVPQPGLRGHRDLGRGGPHRPVHDRRRGQQLSGAPRQRLHLGEELRHHEHSPLVQRHRQRHGLPRRRPGTADQPPDGEPINMMQVSLREPYLFDLPIGAAVSGYLFSRYYPYLWDERRGGGRVSIGRQIGTSTYVDVAAWAEEVDFFGYKTPAPADYLAASGYTQLYAIMPSIRIDNRNNPFMATKGQYANFSVEQGFGSFTFTKFDAEGRIYIPTISRPDGTGKQFFTLRGHFGIATDSTPVYERFFAGNFGSLRGFQYRSVSPHAFGVSTGGIMMAVGSVEYQFPWNAKDTFNQIIFTDFGTVTPNYQLNDMRISVGTGLKIKIPMFGPMPFEFDLAFPVMHAYGDKVQYFNFTMSGFYN